MATRVLKNAYFEFNSVDLSAHVASIELPVDVDSVEDTAMGDNSRSYLPGLRNATINVTFNADDAAGAVSATLWAQIAASQTFEIRPDQGSVSTTNPKYTGSAFWTSFGPVSGAVGDLATSNATFQVTGDVTRATA